VLTELRQSLRSLARRPIFTVTVLATLALGIGAVTTVLSVVSALLIRPLPYQDPSRLVAIWPGHFLANRELAALRERSTSYTDVAMFSPGWLMAMTGTPTPHQIDASRVGGNFFRLLGVQPMLGHTFGLEAETPGQDRVTVLGYELWRSAFGADSTIVGRSVTLDGTSYQVAGVMPRGFVTFDVDADLWTPMTMDPTAMSWAGSVGMAYGRLRPGSSIAGASSELTALAAAMQTEFTLPREWSGGTRVAGLQADMVGGVRPVLLVLIAAVSLLLLIAVANIANLFLVRTAERRQELAVRSSLGAGRGAIVRLLLGEAVSLGAAGGALGLMLAWAGVGLLHRILPPDLPRLGEIAVDGRVVFLAALTTLVAVLLFGTVPALRGAQANAGERMREGRTVAGGGGRTRGALVAAEVALAVVLTVGATLMGRTLVALYNVDRGLRTDHLLTLRLEPSTVGSNDARLAYWRQVIAAVKGLPGVTDAATILHLPASGRSWHAGLEIEGRPLATGEPARTVAWQSVSAEFFQVAGVPILKGRPFSASDGAAAPLVIAINSVVADRWFHGEDPVGRRIAAGNATQKHLATIVAVVGSIRHDSLNGPPYPEVYVPFEQRVVGATSLVVRTSVNPVSVVGAVKDRIWSINHDVPISHIMTMDDLYSASLQRQRMVLTLLGIFASLGMLLSAVGTYGVVAYGVRQRTREIGVRVALGADTGRIKRLVVSQGLRYALAGVLVGIPGALALSGFMRGLVFGVPATDPWALMTAPLALLLVTGVASWIPARRAALTDPSSVLRD
jgi:predicted permease